jgi:AcrR family transcriptional regulator
MLTDLREILEQVAILYAKYGIKSNTMDDVANELGISKKTLYQSFKDKDELVSKVIEYLFLKKQKEILKISTSCLNAIEEMYQIHQQITLMLKEYSNVMMNDLRKYYFEKHTAITKKYRQLLEDIIISNIEKGKKEGLCRLNINSRIIAKSHVAKIMNLPDNYVISIDEYTSKDFSDELFEYHLRGLVNEKGLELSNNFLKK